MDAGPALRASRPCPLDNGMQKIMQWSRKREDCSNCGTKERRHAGRGLCTLCYRLTLKKQSVEAWHLENLSSLKFYPFRGLWIDPQSFERYKKNVILHYQTALENIKHRETKLKGDVDGLDLEYAFNKIASLAGAKDRSLFHGLCGWFEMVFNAEQRRTL